MGLFGGLFDKKTCDICGNKIGLLGNRKLEDGNLCKDCAAKLSPWFSERRHSTLAEIQNQLVYREQNKLAVSAFNVTRSLGKNSWKILLDEDARKFLVTNSGKWQEANPDVLDFSQLTGCDLEIKENRSELKQKDSEGKQVSYNPPRYEYSYNFYVTVRVNHPYFDDMHFMLNSFAVKTGERQMGTAGSWGFSTTGFGREATGLREYQEYVDLGNEIKEVLENARLQGHMPAGGAGYTAGAAGYAAGAAGSVAGAGLHEDVESEEFQAKLKRMQELANDPEALRKEYERAIAEAQATLEKQGMTPPQALTGAEAIAAGNAAVMGMAGMPGGAAMAAAAAAVPGTAAPAGAAAQVKCPWCGSTVTPTAEGKCPLCEGDLG